MKGSYAFQDASRELSVIVLEGDLPRAEIESCLPEALKSSPFPITIEQDGEYAVFVAGEMGKVYATWRDGFVFASTKEGIEAVTNGPRSKEPWPQRLARLPKAQMISASIDPVAGKLFGLSSAGYDLVVDDMDAGARQGDRVVRLAGRCHHGREAAHREHGQVAADPAGEARRDAREIAGDGARELVEIAFDRAAFGALDAKRSMGMRSESVASSRLPDMV